MDDLHWKGSAITDFQAEMNETMDSQRRRSTAILSHHLYGVPLPADLFPPPAPLTLRQRVGRLVGDLRERLALWIAPWLEPVDPMDD